ncbi:hypothetical protein GALL_492000 [mine drainage metagenome]|uniref:Uncharacterized protein n=1 Tax=mine drainage metagenome TaxID=410659 RepID=A0A1J5PV80_9ZZZZ
MIDVAEDAVEPADTLALFVLRRAFIDDVLAHPAIDRSHRARSQRPLDVAEQNDAVVGSGVLGVMQIGLVEQNILALTPGVSLAVDEDPALARRLRHQQPEVVAQRAGIGIAVLHEAATGRQACEHRTLDVRNRIHKLNRLRTIGDRRRQRRFVPFQVKPLPPRAKERVETPVVVFVRGLDLALREQRQRFLADHLPIVAQHAEFGKRSLRQDRPVRHRREQIHQHIIGRHDGGMVSDLTPESKPDPAPQMHCDGRADERPDHKKLRRKKSHDGDHDDEFREPAMTAS